MRVREVTYAKSWEDALSVHEDWKGCSSSGQEEASSKEEEVMESMPVKSSSVIAKGYNALTQDMEMEFPNGTIGSFKAVSPDDSKWFDEQVSAGKALWAFRNAGYTFEKGEK